MQVAWPVGRRDFSWKSRLLQALCAAADVDAKATRAAELRRAQRQALLTALTAWPLDITGHEGYMKVFSAHVVIRKPAASSSCSADGASGSEKCVLCAEVLL